MPKFFKSFLMISLLLVMALGCTATIERETDDGSKEPVEPVESLSSDFAEMPFETVDPSSLKGDLREKVSGPQLEQTMIIMEDSGYKYIFLSAGRKPTNGYEVRVGSLVGFEQLIVLNALLYSPCEADNVEKGATYPSLLIRIPADEREIIYYLSDTRGGYLG